MSIDVNERVTELTVNGKVVQIGLDTTTDSPATAVDILLGKEAWVNNEKVVGSLDLSDRIKPTGEIEITKNGTYNVTNYASANVNVSGSPVLNVVYSAEHNGAIIHFDLNDGEVVFTAAMNGETQQFDTGTYVISGNQITFTLNQMGSITGTILDQFNIEFGEDSPLGYIVVQYPFKIDKYITENGTYDPHAEGVDV